jgi:aspartate aminotransferase
MNVVDTQPLLSAAAKEDLERRGLATMARRLIGSEILKIGAEIKALLEQGAEVLNLTVGDFAPKQFPVPEALAQGIKDALDAGYTHYPSGMTDCRDAVRGLFRDRLGLDYPAGAIQIACGARPLIAGTYLSLIDPGDAVVYGVPSWNNNHYCTMTGARAIEIAADAATGFFPPTAAFERHLGEARLLCLNTPSNPCGTVIARDELAALARSVVAENERRKRAGQKALYLMFDQVYWMLTAPNTRHENPVSLVPEIAPYTIFVDGISKCFAATGLRVGWAAGPTDVMSRMAAILTHVGAWAPTPEQVATAKLLRDTASMDRFLERMQSEVFARLDLLAGAITALKRDGFPVDAVPPAGAIYLSIRVDIAGRTAPGGKRLQTDEDIRAFLLKHAGLAVVPFQAFGLTQDSGWFRASVGTVSKNDLMRGTERLRAALAQLS